MVKTFQGKKVLRENALYKYLMEMLYCVIRANKKYHPQTFLEGCKYEKKMIKIKRIILLMTVLTRVHLINLKINLTTKSGNESENESENKSENESEKPPKKSESD